MINRQGVDVSKIKKGDTIVYHIGANSGPHMGEVACEDNRFGFILGSGARIAKDYIVAVIPEYKPPQEKVGDAEQKIKPGDVVWYRRNNGLITYGEVKRVENSSIVGISWITVRCGSTFLSDKVLGHSPKPKEKEPTLVTEQGAAVSRYVVAAYFDGKRVYTKDKAAIEWVPLNVPVFDFLGRDYKVVE